MKSWQMPSRRDEGVVLLDAGGTASVVIEGCSRFFVLHCKFLCFVADSYRFSSTSPFDRNPYTELLLGFRSLAHKHRFADARPRLKFKS